MVKWADYLISEVSYRPNHLIKIAKRHKDSESGISQGQFIDRLTIASDIKKGYSYMTVYEGLSSWKKGNKINTFRINGEPFIRVDGNKVSLDNLGDLPEVDQKIQNKINEIKDGQKDIKSKTEPEPDLPKDTGTELPQELDLAPEPINEPEPEEATPEQLARLEQLEKQIQELESTPEPEPEKPLQSPRGSLPKDTGTELPQELDLASTKRYWYRTASGT